TSFKRSAFVNTPGSGRKVVLMLSRVLILQTFILITTYSYWYDWFDPSSAIILLALFITTEVVLDRNSGYSFVKPKLSRFFIFLSSSPENLEPNFVTEDNVLEADGGEITQKTEVQTSGLINSSEEGISSSVMISRISLIVSKLIPTILIIFTTVWMVTRKTMKVIFPFIKALSLTVFLFMLSAYEVILTYLILVTGTTKDGLYIIPLFELDLGWLMRDTSNYIVEVGPIYLWIYFAIIMLGLQAVLIAMASLLTVMLRRPEGVTTKLVRLLTRFYMAVILVATLWQLLIGDYYAQFRLLFILFLGVFHELVALKVRFEYKKIKSSEEVLSKKEVRTEEAAVV
ncbi:MAG: hypothetical protein ACTSPV_13090, partial [Candidatus Hodarchaeales archaeon]